MRIPVILVINSMVSVIAGILLAIAFNQTSLVMTASCAAGGVMILFGASICTWVLIQRGFDSIVYQTKDPGREHFDKTLIYEFNTLGRKLGDLRREASTREQQFERQAAEDVATAQEPHPHRSEESHHPHLYVGR